MKTVYFRYDPTRRQQRLFAEAAGEEALARQTKLADERHECCGYASDGPHHPLCAEADLAPAPARIDGQQSLL